MMRVKEKPRTQRAYRFRFLGMPMTFPKLEAYFKGRYSAERLRKFWLCNKRPRNITDPNFFNLKPSTPLPVTVQGVGTFPTHAAVAEHFGVSKNTVARRVKKYGSVLTSEHLKVDELMRARMYMCMIAKQEKAAAKKRVSQPRNKGNDEWNSFTDRPRRITRSEESHTAY